jgi:hypothetical protein
MSMLYFAIKFYQLVKYYHLNAILSKEKQRMNNNYDKLMQELLRLNIDSSDNNYIKQAILSLDKLLESVEDIVIDGRINNRIEELNHITKKAKIYNEIFGILLEDLQLNNTSNIEATANLLSLLESSSRSDRDIYTYLDNFESNFSGTSLASEIRSYKLFNLEELSSKIDEYILQARIKLITNPPSYNPNSGNFLRKEKWKISSKKHQLSAKYGTISKFDVDIYYKKQIDVRKIKSPKGNKYSLECIILPNVDTQVKDYITNLSSRNVAIYIYDISSDKLYFNKNNFWVNYFSFYFQKGGSYKSIYSIIKEKSSNGIIERNKIGWLSQSALETLEKKGYIINLLGGKAYKLLR